MTRDGRRSRVELEERDACAAKLREVCVLMLVYGEPGPKLTGWCLRMLTEPDAAERAVAAVAPRR